MRGEASELRGRERGGGKQQEAKVCHDELKSPKKILNNKQGAC